MANVNSFAEQAAKAKRDMESTLAGGSGTRKRKKAVAPLRQTAIRLPQDVWEKAMMHRVRTGESVNSLVVRLLKRELEKEER